MADIWRLLAATAALLWLTAPASAFYGCSWYAPPMVSYYYAWPTYYYYYTPRVVPVPDAPAAASKPSSDKAPVVIARHANSGAASGSEILKVGFWNLSGHDVTLTVDGKVRTLAKNRAVTIAVPREFSWQIEGAAPHQVRVPDGAAGHEVVIRE